MRLSAFVRAVLMACLVTVTGCATPESPTLGTVSTAGLAGTWRLNMVQRTGGPALAATAGRTYSLSFNSNTVSAHVDCNTCVGSFTLVGDALTISPVLACTRAACPPQEFAAAYEALLPGTSQVSVSGANMVLSSSRGQLYFTRSEAPR